MRTERRQELIEQMQKEEKEIRHEKFCKFTRVFSIIYAVMAIAMVACLFILNMLPMAYMVIGSLVLALFSLFIVPVLFSKRGKVGRKIIALILAICMIGVFAYGSWNILNTKEFINDITKVEEVTEDYYLLAKADALSGEAAEGAEASGDEFDMAVLYGQNVGTVMVQDMRYSEAKAELQNAANVTYIYKDDAKTLYDALINGTGAGTESGFETIFISAALYNSGKTELWPNIEEETRILYTVKLPVEIATVANQVDVTKESFNIYLSGSDLDGVRSDVNMIATVNPVTHQVLLTSIPRDYYVFLPSKAASDKLTHSTLYGIDEAVGAVEATLGVDINYYVRVNYAALKSVVNAIGGVDVDSPFSFRTSGMQELNGHVFVKGMNHLDGDAALAFCRERHSFAAGDMQRNENQQLVLEAILKKATQSSTILSSYGSLLEAVGTNMKTNMTPDEMSAIVKAQVKDMPSWTIERQAIKGTNGFGHCYALGQSAAIVNRIPEEEAKAVDEIIKVFVQE